MSWYYQEHLKKVWLLKNECIALFQLQRSKKVKIEQLSCSNLRHLGAMVECALRPGVSAVCKIFHINNESKLVVDIISDEGKTWIKGMIKF